MSVSQEQVKRYYVERHCAITMRALADNADVEFRQQTPYVNGKAVSLFVPYLQVDAVTDSYEQNRGCSDSIALRLKHSDLALHKELIPENIVAKLIFDTLEQLRCEALFSSHYAGVKKNIDTTFNQWCKNSLGNGFTENEIGLLIFTVIQVVRGRLIHLVPDEEIEGLIESVRFRLVPVIGDDLVALKKNQHNQSVYAQAALNIAHAVEAIANSFGESSHNQRLTALRNKNLLPPIVVDNNQDFQSGNLQSLEAVTAFKDYHVFCTQFDRQCQADSLYRLIQCKNSRQELDKAIASQAMSVTRLALRMRKIFATWHNSGWQDGQEQGYLDGRRLVQLVTKKNDIRVFKQQQPTPLCDTALTFLVDNSGSMRSRCQSIAVLIDIFVQALELAGVEVEVLGFTTGGWTGGQSMKAWHEQNRPANPGRLNDRLHIVYKSFANSRRQSRLSLATMMDPLHFKEGLDGEALEWAAERLNRKTQARKCLVMISDGAPMDTATSYHNDDDFLTRHLQATIKKIEGNSPIELKAVSVGLDVCNLFKNSIPLDLTGTLDNSAFGMLETLFLKR